MEPSINLPLVTVVFIQIPELNYGYYARKMIHFHNEVGKPSQTSVISMLTSTRLRCGWLRFLLRRFCLRWLTAAADGQAEIPCVALSACGPLEAERKGHGLCHRQLYNACYPSSQHHRDVRVGLLEKHTCGYVRLCLIARQGFEHVTASLVTIICCILVPLTGFLTRYLREDAFFVYINIKLLFVSM